MKPLSFTKVTVEDKFWAPRIRTNRDVTLPIEYQQLKKTGRYDAWSWREGKKNKPHIFWNSDVAKWIEAVAYSLAAHPDPKLERAVDKYIATLAKGQMDDGYLNVHFALVEPENRWTNLCDEHELYGNGHQIEAAVAYYHATGKRDFLDIMKRCADHICRTFGPERGKKRGYPGHQEIELALIKLFNVTGDKKYLEMAEFFLTERGKSGPHYYNKEAKARGAKARPVQSYINNQAHLPVLEQKEAVGHAVRACYMYAGMVDVVRETGNRELKTACKRVWKNLVEKRMYITGGIGSENSSEGFTCDYDLPNEKGYAETCAAIALIFFAHRMFHLEKDGQYIDVMERALYNGALSGVALNGKEFFYANRLAVLPQAVKASHHVYPPQRQEWFGCACCPTNIVRLLASFGNYIYSQSRDAVWVNLYAAGSAKLEISGAAFTVSQKTEYPWKEKVSITLSVNNPVTCGLHLRIPDWCKGARISVNGKPISLHSITKKGYARLKRTWRGTDSIEMFLPMPVEKIEAHPDVRQDAGKLALQRGPLVYCLEEADNGRYLDRIFIADDAKCRLQHKDRLLGGLTVINLPALIRDDRGWSGKIYRPVKQEFKKKQITAIPYYAWANRKQGEMLVWINQK